MKERTVWTDCNGENVQVGDLVTATSVNVGLQGEVVELITDLKSKDFRVRLTAVGKWKNHKVGDVVWFHRDWTAKTPRRYDAGAASGYPGRLVTIPE